MNTNQQAAASQNAKPLWASAQVSDIVRNASWKIRDDESFETSLTNNGVFVYCRIVSTRNDYFVYDSYGSAPARFSSLQGVIDYINRHFW